jgi:hypothetical protein
MGRDNDRRLTGQEGELPQEPGIGALLGIRVAIVAFEVRGSGVNDDEPQVETLRLFADTRQFGGDVHHAGYEVNRDCLRIESTSFRQDQEAARTSSGFSPARTSTPPCLTSRS